MWRDDTRQDLLADFDHRVAPASSFPVSNPDQQSPQRMNELALPDAQAGNAITDLPAIAKEAKEAWTQIERSNLGNRMKSALRRIACGENIRGQRRRRGTDRTPMSTATPSNLWPTRSARPTMVRRTYPRSSGWLESSWRTVKGLSSSSLSAQQLPGADADRRGHRRHGGFFTWFALPDRTCIIGHRQNAACFSYQRCRR